MPVALVNWYYNGASTILSGLNSLLNQTLVNQTCSSNFDCIHDYIIRINPVSSSATAQSTNLLQQSRSVLGKKFLFYFSL